MSVVSAVRSDRGQHDCGHMGVRLYIYVFNGVIYYGQTPWVSGVGVRRKECCLANQYAEGTHKHQISNPIVVCKWLRLRAAAGQDHPAQPDVTGCNDLLRL
jgi:hypothetical protein